MGKPPTSIQLITELKTFFYCINLFFLDFSSETKSLHETDGVVGKAVELGRLAPVAIVGVQGRTVGEEVAVQGVGVVGKPSAIGYWKYILDMFNLLTTFVFQF